MIEDGGGSSAWAQLALCAPGSSGSGIQQHQGLCGPARGSEGKVRLGSGAGSIASSR